MNSKEEISKFSKLFNKGDKVVSTQFNWWEKLSDFEKEQQRYSYYRDWLSKWHEVESYSWFEDEEEPIVRVKYNVRDSDLGNQFLYWKMMYLHTNNYVDKVVDRLYNEKHILYDRRSTELRKRKRKDGSVKYVERRFWRPDKSGEWCEVFFRYGRNKRYDLVDNNTKVLMVPNRRIAVLNTFEILERVFAKYYAEDIHYLWVKKLENDLRKKITKQYEFYNRFYCKEGEKIENAFDLVHYKKRMDLLEETYGSHLLFLMCDIRFRGDFDFLDDFEWDSDEKVWKIVKFREEFLKPMYRKMKMYEGDYERVITDLSRNDKDFSKKIYSKEFLDDLFEE